MLFCGVLDAVYEHRSRSGWAPSVVSEGVPIAAPSNDGAVMSAAAIELMELPRLALRRGRTWPADKSVQVDEEWVYKMVAQMRSPMTVIVPCTESPPEGRGSSDPNRSIALLVLGASTPGAFSLRSCGATPRRCWPPLPSFIVL